MSSRKGIFRVVTLFFILLSSINQAFAVSHRGMVRFLMQSRQMTERRANDISQCLMNGPGLENLRVGRVLTGTRVMGPSLFIQPWRSFQFRGVVESPIANDPDGQSIPIPHLVNGLLYNGGLTASWVGYEKVFLYLPDKMTLRTLHGFDSGSSRGIELHTYPISFPIPIDLAVGGMDSPHGFVGVFHVCGMIGASSVTFPKLELSVPEFSNTD